MQLGEPHAAPADFACTCCCRCRCGLQTDADTDAPHAYPRTLGPPPARRQLPALLLWLAAADGDGSTSGAGASATPAGAAAQALRAGGGGEKLRWPQELGALSEQQLRELGDGLAAPTAALAVFGQWLRAQQALQGAPATMQQVRLSAALPDACAWTRGRRAPRQHF